MTPERAAYYRAELARLEHEIEIERVRRAHAILAARCRELCAGLPADVALVVRDAFEQHGECHAQRVAVLCGVVLEDKAGFGVFHDLPNVVDLVSWFGVPYRTRVGRDVTEETHIIEETLDGKIYWQVYHWRRVGLDDESILKEGVW